MLGIPIIVLVLAVTDMLFMCNIN